MEGMTCRPRFIPAPAGNTHLARDAATLIAVHPPHPRGTRSRMRPSCGRWRFIPAPAGNTAAIPWRVTKRAVHPRTRGEHRIDPRAEFQEIGSSPHPRGTRRGGFARWLIGRFIPAPAGNTTRTARRSQHNTVHPRTRGEHKSGGVDGVHDGGSSPHPRGTLSGRCCVPTVTRFIPAPAGNTSRRRSASMGPTVHPRTRGEHKTPMDMAGLLVGSSPHPRGTRLTSSIDPTRDWFIPAPAGNTAQRPRASSIAAVHPRTRGEHPVIACPSPAGTGSSRTRGEHLVEIPNANIYTGSSPHPRGTRSLDRMGRGDRRFIPAPAGNTSDFAASRVSSAVHPRTRGEHDHWTGWVAAIAGSSPHPRGTRATSPRPV